MRTVPANPVVAPLPDAVDWREPERRRGVFQDWYEFSLCTATFPGLVYALIPWLRDHYSWDEEEVFWFAFLNGNCQHPLSSLLMHRRGSRPSEAKGVLNFFRDNRLRLGWDTDRRHHRPALPLAVESYVQLLQGRSQGDYWREAASKGWRNLWDTIGQIYSFGRLTSWSFCDYLHICGVDIEPDDLMLEDKEGSRSHRNGLCIVAGLDVYDWHQSNPSFNGNYPKSLLQALGGLGGDLLSEARERAAGQPWERDVSYLTLESVLCTYKSWHRPNRRYPGVYADMLYERIKKTEKDWPNEDLSVFWEARKDCLPQWMRLEDMPTDPGLHGCGQVKPNWYRQTGEVPVIGRVYEKYLSRFDLLVDEGEFGVFR